VVPCVLIAHVDDTVMIREGNIFHNTRRYYLYWDGTGVMLTKSIESSSLQVSATTTTTTTQFKFNALNYTVSTKKVTPCIHCHNSDKQYQILTEFWTNNAISNCKQITKFK